MSRVIKICVLGLLLSWPLTENVDACDLRSAIRAGLKDLAAEKGLPGLCVLTDATYVRVHGRTSEPVIDLIREETGCTVGRGNLLFFHRPTNYPLKIAMFFRDTEQCVVVSSDGRGIEWKKYDFGKKAVAKPSFWAREDALLSPDTFTIVSLSKAWAAGAPHDLLKCAEFHNHLCPAIVSGYMIARYITESYPLKKEEAYVWIACPPWCKDDAVQVLLDLTAGKKCLYAVELTEYQKKELTFENPAGMLIIWNEQRNMGKGVVFSFDWEKARREDKLQMVIDLLPYAEKPEEFVSVVRESELTPEILEKLKTSDTNPYKWLGLTK
jgi:formylmethanofuran dehydrogenase subunit E-like metal-binding protein